ncbi:MAG: DoxX family protein [Candidatus Liptonbacteria bacterium]|nr:DoxX family protein [Candidatus Liptonbacteria bacterium]
MSRFQKVSLLFARVSLGWLFFYSGITKILNPDWSAAGYIKGAQIFPSFFAWLLRPDILPTVNFLNEWGQLLLGVSLIIGFLVRPSAFFGAALLALYYLAALKFPYPNANSYIVDEHIIYIFILLYFAAIRAGKVFGLDGYFRHRLGLGK